MLTVPSITNPSHRGYTKSDLNIGYRRLVRLSGHGRSELEVSCFDREHKTESFSCCGLIRIDGFELSL